MRKPFSILSIFASLFAIPILLKRKKTEDKTGDSETNGTQSQTLSNEELAPPAALVGQVEDVREAKATENEGKESVRPVSQRRWRNAQWQTLLAGTLVFLTLVNVATAILQWLTMEKSLRISQRAYVDVDSIETNWPVNIFVLLKNIGHVPAEIIIVKGSVNILIKLPNGDYKVLKQIPFSHNYRHAQIYPGNRYTQISVSLEDLTEQDKNLVINSQAVLAVGLFVQYKDGFGYTDKSDFGFDYQPPPRHEWVASRTFSNTGDLQNVK
jgi:hypothetical protein